MWPRLPGADGRVLRGQKSCLQGQPAARGCSGGGEVAPCLQLILPASAAWSSLRLQHGPPLICSVILPRLQGAPPGVCSVVLPASAVWSSSSPAHGHASSLSTPVRPHAWTADRWRPKSRLMFRLYSRSEELHCLIDSTFCPLPKLEHDFKMPFKLNEIN